MGDQMRLPFFGIGEAEQGEVARLEEWRHSVEALFDVEPTEFPFEARISSFNIGEILFGTSAATGQTFVRDRTVIERSGIDHLLVQIYVRGHFVCTIGEESHVVTEGQVSVLDLACEFTSTATRFANYNLIVPRSIFGLMPGDSRLHGHVVDRTAVPARMLLAHLRSLEEICRSASTNDMSALASSTINALTSTIEPAHARFAPPSEADRSLFADMCRFIEANLANKDLGAEMLRAEFGASRATIYRMFESRGGVATYIRRRRLELVCKALSGDFSERESLASIARRFGFPSENTFSRAFRSATGASPSQWRRRVRQSSPGEIFAPIDHSVLTGWMRDL